MRRQNYHGAPHDARPTITVVEVKALARVVRLVEVAAEAIMGSYRLAG